MSIVLKTDPKELAPFAHVTASQHDAIAAHAMQMAIEEAKQYDDTERDFMSTEELCDWINERAAVNLARLMKETK